MSKSKNPHITFTVSKEFKSEAEEFAKTKGFVNASSLARVALVAYMRKNPISAKSRASAAAEQPERA